VILLLFLVLFLGVINSFILERYLPFVPYTAALFMEGLTIAIVQAIRRAHDKILWVSFDSAITIWANADPHLILFVFLPPLVFGEAMQLNVSLVKACFKQCLLLAGPGVLIGAALTGAAGRYLLPYGWDWNTAMLFGAIVSATDPVAVVAIFNSLGVSPRLTMVISGESLFNDGTAYVLFSLFLILCSGVQPTLAWLVGFLFQMTFAGPIVGLLLGQLAVWFIGLSSVQHYHGDSMGQVIVTVCCGYLSFFIAEEMNSSGMLALVASGLVVATSAWPRFIERETLQTIWHAIEFVANTVIFVLSGIIFGGLLCERRHIIEMKDFAVLGMVYLVSMLIRMVMVGILWVPLNKSGNAITIQEGIVMIWSGMRGAVGLLMALVADQDENIDAKARTLIIFHAGGMAAIMQLINGPLTPTVLRLCGLMDSTDKENVISDVQKRIAARTKDQMRKDLKGEDTRALFSQAVEKQVSAIVFHPIVDPQGGEDSEISARTTAAIRPEKLDTDTAELRRFRTSAEKETLNRNQLRMLRESLMRVVKNSYWDILDGGVLARKSSVTKVLLESADLGMLETLSETHELSDWETVRKGLEIGEYKDEQEFRAASLYKYFFKDFENYQQRGITAALAFIHAHEVAVNVLKSFMAGDAGESLEESFIINAVEEQNKKPAVYLESMPKDMVTLTQNKMLARKLLAFQAKQVSGLASRGLISDTHASELEHRLHASARGVWGLRLEHAASWVPDPRGLAASAARMAAPATTSADTAMQRVMMRFAPRTQQHP
jgi:NhaP-type Na+/H+ or K+/H+ antiporter